VPGQVYYNATRKLVLRGADGVVFVADSQREQFDENIESLRNLHENLLEEDIEVGNFPMVIQYNKRDLPGVLPIAELDDALNFRGGPSFPAAAVSGDGVFDTLKSVSQLVLQNLSKRFGQEIRQPE
jgi:mutual gliding-motility protein MglA